MCLEPREIRLPSINTYRWLRGERSPRYVMAPCGHCIECLNKRQNDLSARIYQESKTKSRMYFVTFTYAPIHEPYAGTLWSVEHDTGFMRRVSEPVLLDSENEYYREAAAYFKILSIPKSGVTRIFEKPLPVNVIPIDTDIFDIFTDGRMSLYLRVTPSLNMRDPRMCIKRWRTQFERDFGKKLPEFSYCLVGEMGLQYTRRPHYHMVILSNELEKWHVVELVKQWTYGRTQIDVVPRYNDNGSDAFAAISRYIGKYISKGPFDVDSAKQGLVKGSRICTSKHLGQTLTQREIDYFTCQDIKRFNQNLAFEELSEDDKKIILPAIVQRLKYRITTKKGRVLLFSMPLSLKKQIFNYAISKTTSEVTYSSLYYMVSDFVRSQYIESCSREFEQFRASRPPGETFNKTVSLYERFKEDSKQNRKKVLLEGLRAWYGNHAKF